ncbi:MAG TPA: hypothetical protein VGO42_09290 [Reyranella sp.]|jgi:hypothetical protein|nr:hypothetical protein [Reyranella sp.]
MRSSFGAWLAWGTLAAAVVFLAFHLLGDNNLESSHGTAESTQQ